MPSKNHRSGGKTSKSHTTFIDAARSIVQFGEKFPAVKRVSLGRISANLGGTSKQRVSVQREHGCLRLQVRGGSSAQEIIFYTDSPGYVEDHLKKELSGKYQFK